MADDVRDEWAREAFAVQPNWHVRDIKAVISAVAPLIRADEREACAKELEAENMYISADIIRRGYEK